jgi:SAM-dependent methyltransferase
MEEIDLCWRLRLQGFRAVYVPSAVVYHIGGYSLDKRVLKRMYLNHRNSLTMLLKNYSARSLLRLLPVKLALELGIAAGALLRNPQRSRAVLMALAWHASHARAVWRLRAGVQARRRVPDSGILPHLYPGMAPLWYFAFGVREACDLPDVERVLHQPAGPGRELAAGERLRPARRDFLFAWLDQAPTAVALGAAAECERLAGQALERPVLELGCGDGTFARLLLGGRLVDLGVDPDARACARARATRCYGEVRCAAPDRLPCEPGSLATVLARGALGSPPGAEAALAEIARVLRPGGRLLLAVPSPACGRELRLPRALATLGLRGLAERCRRLELRALGAGTLAAPAAWEERLRAAGLEVLACEPFLPPRAARLRELFLPAAAPAAAAWRLRRRRLWLPRLHRLVVRLYRRALLRPHRERGAEGAGALLVARKGEPVATGGPGRAAAPASG